MLQIVSEYLQVCDVYLRPQYDVINNSKRKVIQNRGLLLLHYRFDHLLLKNQQKIHLIELNEDFLGLGFLRASTLEVSTTF